VSGPSASLEKRTRDVLNMISDEASIGKDLIGDEEIVVNDEYIGAGYGHPSEAGVAAIRTIAESEGVILDPIYTSKAMSAMLDMLKSRKLQNPRDVVFLHTGGAPAIHPYAEFLRS